MKERGIETEVEGYSGEDAVVVKPGSWNDDGHSKGKKSKLTSIPAKRLVSIELYDRSGSQDSGLLQARHRP